MTHAPDEREHSLAVARAALRADRERLAADRAAVDGLLAEARAAQKEASRERARARQLAGRFVRKASARFADRRKQVEAREAELAAARDRFAVVIAHLNALRSEFHSTAAAARDRLRDAWADVETHQRRASMEWAEAGQYFTEQTAELDSRAIDLAQREKTLADRRAHAEAETAGLREEAAALETRVANARAALNELEQRRDRVRAELLGTDPAPELAGSAAGREPPAADREKVAALKSALDREAADLDDRRRVLAEQFTLLAEARAKWQAAETQTVLELEDLAHALGRREQELDARDRRLIRADARRREAVYDLWQHRLRLEAWQSRLTAVEMRADAERGQLEADLECRIAAAARREADLELTFARWGANRTRERETLRAELDYWAADRERLAKAEAEFRLQRQLLDAEVSTCAARAMAAEEIVAAAMQDGGSDWSRRRLAMLQKRWVRVFDRKLADADRRHDAATAERAALDDRYRDLQKLLAHVVEREATLNGAVAANDLARVARPDSVRGQTPPASQTAGAELIALREELERVATFMVELEPLEAPISRELDLSEGVKADGHVGLLPFGLGSRAA